jgi:hypothetical protein
VTEQAIAAQTRRAAFPNHGWIGFALVGVFWAVNWGLDGNRTAWAFFPLWLGYCLVVDALAFRLHGTSLLTRSTRKYVGLFLVSDPAWWLFEAINLRLQNWHYLGREDFSNLEYAITATINFSIVIPAVFGTAELFAGMGFIRRMKASLVIPPTRLVTLMFFLLGLVFLGLMLWQPDRFFPLVWLSLIFLLEPVNIWLGNRSLTHWTAQGDWRPVVSLFLGALACGFFWEMWNYYSHPKWIYSTPGVDFLKVFEMPLLGYGGYLPFALELFALYHLVTGLLGDRLSSYLRLEPSPELAQTQRG